MSLENILTIEQDFSVSIDFKVQTECVYVEIEDEWCGDTVTGFGSLAGINLNYEQVKEVHLFLGNWLKSHNKTLDLTA